MTNLSLKNIKNNIIDPHHRMAARSNNYIEVSKVGTKNSKKVIMPAKGKQKNLTEFQNRFKAKQTIKKYYGNLSENYFANKKTNSATNSDSLVCELEKRLDVVVFRLGFSSSILEARSLIKSGLVKINDKVVHSHSYSKSVNVGSKITVDVSKLTYLAKIKHLKFNLFKTPTHLVTPSQIGASVGESSILEGYFIQNPIESEVFLPNLTIPFGEKTNSSSNFPINKIR
jgi:ribosomal protein S4